MLDVLCLRHLFRSWSSTFLYRRRWRQRQRLFESELEAALAVYKDSLHESSQVEDAADGASVVSSFDQGSYPDVSEWEVGFITPFLEESRHDRRCG